MVAIFLCVPKITSRKDEYFSNVSYHVNQLDPEVFTLRDTSGDPICNSRKAEILNIIMI